jgi:hypothetical protein
MEHHDIRCPLCRGTGRLTNDILIFLFQNHPQIPKPVPIMQTQFGVQCPLCKGTGQTTQAEAERFAAEKLS